MIVQRWEVPPGGQGAQWRRERAALHRVMKLPPHPEK